MLFLFCVVGDGGSCIIDVGEDDMMFWYIYVVDDNYEFCDFLCFWLEGFGC